MSTGVWVKPEFTSGFFMELSMLWWLLASTPIGVGFAGNILPMLPAWLGRFNRIGAAQHDSAGMA